MRRQAIEAVGPENRWYFGIDERRDPVDFEELFVHYIDRGGAEGFAQKENEE